MIEWDWGDPGVVGAAASVVGAAASVIVPILVAWIGFAVQSRGKRTERQLAEIQAAQLELNSRQRRDSLLVLLPEVSSPTHFQALRTEALAYSGSDLDLLLTALRLNPLEPLPTRDRSRKKLSAKEAEDFINSLFRRYNGKIQSARIKNLIYFVNLCHHDLTDDEFNSLQLGPVIAQLFRTSHGIGHLGVREIITEGSWKMAPEFLSELDHLPHDGHSLNLLTGTMLGIMDIGARRTNQKNHGSGYPSLQNVNRFNEHVRHGLASLLHRQRLQQLGQWDQKDFTDAITAPVAWLIRAVGYVVAGDEHVTMRIIQNLEPVIRSLDDLYWGVDEPTLIDGLDQIQRRCPGLWRRYGPGIMAATGVSLTSSNGEGDMPILSPSE